MSNEDLRWQQRFQHFENAFRLLQNAIAIEKPSVVERAGLVKFFELSFELGWKLLKDYEETEGFLPKSPRDAIRQGLELNLISHGHTWMDALDNRELATQTYEEETAVDVERKIRGQYLPLLQELYSQFSVRLQGVTE